jgi:hypothetical protein
MRDPQWEQSKFNLLGVPSHLYKQSVAEAFKWGFKVLTGRTNDAFTSECRLRFFTGFFRQRRRQPTQT